MNFLIPIITVPIQNSLSVIFSLVVQAAALIKVRERVYNFKEFSGSCRRCKDLWIKAKKLILTNYTQYFILDRYFVWFKTRLRSLEKIFLWPSFWDLIEIVANFICDISMRFYLDTICGIFFWALIVCVADFMCQDITFSFFFVVNYLCDIFYAFIYWRWQILNFGCICSRCCVRV